MSPLEFMQRLAALVPRRRLHLYGRMMNSFNVYDISSGTRQRVRVEHNES